MDDVFSSTSTQRPLSPMDLEPEVGSVVPSSPKEVEKHKRKRRKKDKSVDEDGNTSHPQDIGKG